MRDDIFNKSRAIAIDGELQKRANDRVEEEVRFREKIVETENEINRLRKGPKNLISNASLKDNIAFLAKIKADFKKFTDDNLKADEVLFTAKEEYSKKSKKLTDDEKTGLDGIKTGVDAITSANERLIKSGTIEFFQAQIDGLQKLQKEQATTNGEWLKYQSNIDAIQVKIDALQNKGIKLPKPQVAEFDGIVPTFSLGNLEEQKSYYETQQKLFSTTSDEYQKYADLINGIQIKINAIQGVDESIAKVEEMKSSLISFNESISSAMTTAVASFAEGFGQVLSGLSGGATVLGSIGNLFLSTLAGLMEQVGKIAIETGLAILGIKTALKSLNPGVAIAAGVALIALSAVVKSQISDAGAFANGGIVGGTSVTGDKLFARVNSGEMILNKNQQRNLSNMINPAVSAGDVAVQLIGGFEIDGSKLRLVLDRSTASKNRKS